MAEDETGIYSCGSRINYLQRLLKPGAAQQQVACEFPLLCGACGLIPSPPPLPPPLPPSPPGESCESQYGNLATDESGTFSCWERIVHLTKEGYTEIDARNQVAKEHPGTEKNQCGYCASPSPSKPPTACDNVAMQTGTDDDGEHTCESRIEWLMLSQGLCRQAAELQVGLEFPEEENCGACTYGFVPTPTPP